MKKVLSLILATLLVLTSVAAVAEALPSKTTTDITVVNEVVAENGEVIITVVEPTEKVLEALTAAVEAVLGGAKAVTIFDEDVQAAIAEKMGDVELELNEIVAVAAPDYTEENGAVTAKFTFATAYTAEQKLVAVVCTYTGDVHEEFVLDAAANEDGTVSVTFTVEAMAAITAADAATLSILNTK